MRDIKLEKQKRLFTSQTP